MPLKQFKKLPQGYYRLLIVGWIIVPIIVSSLDSKSNMLPNLVAGIVIYYILARFVVWIYLGFKNK